MRRGDIHSVDLDPARESEANKLRPAVIVSNDAANSTARRLGRGVVTVAQAEQVRSIAVERIGVRLGVVPARFMRQIDDALRLHLAL
jgi:mRNA interferase MazF